MKEKVLWASIYGGIYTVHYAMKNGGESIHSEGYEISMILDLPKNTPIFRFDKSKFEDVLKNTFGSNKFCKEYRSIGMFDNPEDALSLKNYVKNAQENGIVIEYL